MLSIIIPTRNRPDLLKSCLKRILDNSILPSQIIIVDSSDYNQRIKDTYSDTRIVYQTTEIKSAAIQRNIGMEFYAWCLATNPTLLKLQSIINIRKETG